MPMATAMITTTTTMTQMAANIMRSLGMIVTHFFNQFHDDGAINHNFNNNDNNDANNHDDNNNNNNDDDDDSLLPPRSPPCSTHLRSSTRLLARAVESPQIQPKSCHHGYDGDYNTDYSGDDDDNCGDDADDDDAEDPYLFASVGLDTLITSLSRTTYSIKVKTMMIKMSVKCWELHAC